MCQSVAYALAAATGTRAESERPAEWKPADETDEGDPEHEEPPIPAP